MSDIGILKSTADRLQRMGLDGDGYYAQADIKFLTRAADAVYSAAAEIERLRAERDEARNAAIEEAAKVADRFEAEYASERDKHVHGTPDHWMNNSGSYAAMDIASAIRSLRREDRG